MSKETVHKKLKINDNYKNKNFRIKTIWKIIRLGDIRVKNKKRKLSILLQSRIFTNHRGMIIQEIPITIKNKQIPSNLIILLQSMMSSWRKRENKNREIIGNYSNSKWVNKIERKVLKNREISKIMLLKLIGLKNNLFNMHINILRSLKNSRSFIVEEIQMQLHLSMTSWRIEVKMIYIIWNSKLNNCTQKWEKGELIRNNFKCRWKN